MKTHKKVWIVLAGSVLSMVLIACSCGSLTSLLTPTGTPFPTVDVPVIVPTVQVCGYGELPYFDDFSDQSTGWDVFDNDGAASGYGSSYYYVVSRTTDYSTYGASNRLFADTIIDVDATPVSGPDAAYFSYSVDCRLQEGGDGYVFEATGDGYYAVGYYTGGGQDYTSLLSEEWTPSDAIIQGYQTNHITVVCDGSHLSMSINGVTVFDGTDTTFSDGDIGLGAGTYDPNMPVEVHFETLIVMAP